MNNAHRHPLNAAGIAMWTLVERYTGGVGYRGGVKAEGLAAVPPVIDCSGWVSLLLSAGMKAFNNCGHEEFTTSDFTNISSWSDRIIQEIEARTGIILEGNEIVLGGLPRLATVGLRQGGGDWAKNRPRPRGITHVVQIVEHPSEGTLFVSESQGWAKPTGLRLLPLSDWLDLTSEYLRAGEAWAVDAFSALRQREKNRHPRGHDVG
jgi:hypothetical protein